MESILLLKNQGDAMVIFFWLFIWLLRSFFLEFYSSSLFSSLLASSPLPFHEKNMILFYMILRRDYFDNYNENIKILHQMVHINSLDCIYFFMIWLSKWPLILPIICLLDSSYWASGCNYKHVKFERYLTIQIVFKVIMYTLWIWFNLIWIQADLILLLMDSYRQDAQLDCIDVLLWDLCLTL